MRLSPLLAFLALIPLAACNPALNTGGPGASVSSSSKVTTDARIAFAPLTGPPQKIADALAVEVARGATSRGIALANFQDATANYTMKGYLSAVAEDDGTLVVYVWDVLSPDLKRVHRIAGKIMIERKASDPWSAVDDKTLALVSQETLDKLTSWLASG